MVLSSLGAGAGLVEYLEQRARKESLSGLIGRAVVAVAVLVVGVGPLPSGKPVVVTLAITYLAFAAWGLLDRARSYSPVREWAAAAQSLRLLCALVVGLGVLSGIGLLLAIGFALLGDPWVL